MNKIALVFLATLASWSSAKPSALKFEDIMQQSISKGEDEPLRAPLARLVGLTERDFQGRTVDVDPTETTDGMRHDFMVVLDTNSKALAVDCSTQYDSSGDRDSYHFLLSLNGVLEHALLIKGKLLPDGKPVRGSGVAQERDIKSSEIRRRVKHEMDFWLKGMYRKKVDLGRPKQAP
ncbi:MAG: hypothetical protein NTX64_06950 [Elusimicrobia bacterium]|nr:hypothetical protein [Elusimicrobiota bacterium]